MRDRLIEILEKADLDFGEHSAWCAFENSYCCFIADQLLADGVIVPPCKVGDTLWIVGEHRGVYGAKVRVFFFNENGVEYIRTTHCDIHPSELGKTVFLTREKAEKALGELQYSEIYCRDDCDDLAEKLTAKGYRKESDVAREQTNEK